MVVRVKTNRIFSGKLYAKERPNSCVTDVAKGLEFELRLGYQDLGCDVKQEGQGKYFTEVVIQVFFFTVISSNLSQNLIFKFFELAS